MNVAPCRGCPERKLKCHADCEAYIRWTKEKEADKQKLQEYSRQYFFNPHIQLTRQGFKGQIKGKKKGGL